MAFTYFFRDLQTLEAIRDYALPELKAKKFVDIWDAGCAMGQEPYSLSMIFNDSMGYMYFRNVRILATDIDQSNIFEEIISKAAYPEEQIQRIPKGVFSKFFSSDNQVGYYKLNKEIRNSVTFKKHDLLTLTPPDKDFGLIVCKNVLLHFSEPDRVNIIKMFHSALSEGGFLALEQTQKLPKETQQLFTPVVANSQVFKKI